MTTFGITTIVGSHPDYNPVHRVRASLSVLPVDGYVYKMSAYMDGIVGFGAPQHIRLAVYENNLGAPGAFKCVSDERLIYPDDDPAWLDFAFPAEVFFDGSPTGYWLGIWGGGQSLSSKFYRIPNAVSGCYSTATTTYSQTGDPIDPFGTPVSQPPDTGDLCVYATYLATTEVPLNYVAPVVYGTNIVGAVLTADVGNWAGGVTGYSYQWKADGVNVGSNSATYTVAAAGHSVTCDVTATNVNGTTTETTVALTANYANWNPNYQQYEDPDTIWLYDADVEPNYGYVEGGLIDSSGGFKGFNVPGTIADSDPWRMGSPYAVESGKYRTGTRGGDGTVDAAYMWMPGEHLPTAEWTVECFVRNDVDWLGGSLLSFGGDPDGLAGVMLGGDADAGGAPTCDYGHRQDENGTDTHVSTGWSLTPLTSAFGIPVADQWVSLAASYDGTTLRFWHDAELVGSRELTAPYSWATSDRQGGLALLFGSSRADMTGWTISDIRVSRLARQVGVPRLVTGPNTVTISDTPTGSQISQNLRGGLHYFAGESAAVGDTVSEELNRGYPSLSRTDKFLSCIRIKAGAPDSTHPTHGHSGSYSYHWGPVDNTIDYMKRLDLGLYLGFDSTPQLLGGSHAPFSLADCEDTTKLVGFADFNGQVPSDFAAFATIAADFYHYVTVTRGETVKYWTWWNEPDGFWAGTQTQLNNLYLDVYNAVKAIDPDAEIGGDDGRGLSLGDAGQPPWDTMFAFFQANDIAPSNISYHHYGGEIGSPAYFSHGIQYFADTYGVTKPDLICGEWNWNAANFHGQMMPWNPNHFGINDWAGAFYATMLIGFQQYGFVSAIFTHLWTAELADTLYDAQALTSATNPWVARNVFEIWRNFGTSDVLTIDDSDLENGVRVIAGNDNEGVIRVLAVNYKWRMERTTDLTITLPNSVADAIVVHHVIDADHSNYFDQGSGDGTLETVTAPTITDGAVTLTMAPRSVHLLEFAVDVDVPIIVTEPVITGAAIEGATLTCSTGTWTNTPTSYAYLWQTSPDGVTWTSATTGSTLLLSGYNDLYIRCQVTASNIGGASAPAYSGVAGPVASTVVASLDIYGITVADGVPYLVRCHPN